MMRRLTIGVSPELAARSHERLLRTLECVYPVRFERRRPGEQSGLDGAIVIAERGERARRLRLPTLTLRPPESRPATVRVRLAGDARLHPALQRRQLLEERTPLGTLRAGAGDTVLATDPDGAPIWLVVASEGAAAFEAAAGLPEMCSRDLLRDHLRPGDFMGLLPISHFLRELVGEAAWTSPPLGAAVILDDPNLHWPSYGYIDFAGLAAHAELHRYHAVIATIPLDGYFIHPGAARAFRAATDRLSLAVHGNDHTRAELDRADRDGARRLGAAALARVGRFERRSGLAVSRVMIPPHERGSFDALAGLFDAGFDGISAAPTIATPAGPLPHIRAAGDWGPAQLFAGGFPLFARRPLHEDPDDLVFRAYLGQPLILYGHHTDLADGLDALETTAAMINALPDVAWAPLHAIAAATHRSRRDGPAMTVRMHSLAADLRVPEGVETLTVELPAVVGDGRRLEVRCAPGGTEPITLHESEPSDITFALPPGHIGQLHVRIASSAEPQVRGRRVRPVWPAWRRALTECRDRSAPARSRFSGLAR